MPVRTSEAVWKGTLVGGVGEMKTGSGGIKFPYSFSSRFEAGKGSNPEELIGAAHAGCFSMAFAGILEHAGHVPASIKTVARVAIEKDAAGFAITSIDLATEASVSGLDETTFQKLAEEAKRGCPVSRALAGTKISVAATLLPPDAAKK
ncbi:MAG TPA: OsmC family protein [Chitinivibrionales bacterium]|nr:OsmC family protein [Chitinivibrionales bacterium]